VVCVGGSKYQGRCGQFGVWSSAFERVRRRGYRVVLKVGGGRGARDAKGKGKGKCVLMGRE